VNPSDDTQGSRKPTRTDLVSDSVKQALATEVEPSTRKKGRPRYAENASTDTAFVTRPPARVRSHV
jgi:hypothetical protein